MPQVIALDANLLELVWVLEVNHCSATDIVRCLNLLLGLPNFKPQNADA